MKKIRRVVLLVGLLYMCTGCGTLDDSKIVVYEDANITQAPVTVSPVQTSKANETLDKDYELKFVDVKGNEYATTILGSVKKHTYDFKALKNDKMIYSYSDPKTKQRAKFGVDISKYQGKVDFNKLKKAGAEYVIIRLGYRGYGEEGTLNLDDRYVEYIKGANKAGIKTGVYFFSQAVNAKEAKEEAAYVIKNIKQYKIDAPVVFDTEEMKDVKGARTAGIDKKIFTDCCIAFCDEIKAAGYSPMIYFNMKWQVFMLDVTRLTAYKKWYADYEKVPQSPYEFAMWQYTETGKIDGISGNVDLNLWFE